MGEAHIAQIAQKDSWESPVGGIVEQYAQHAPARQEPPAPTIQRLVEAHEQQATELRFELRDLVGRDLAAVSRDAIWHSQQARRLRSILHGRSNQRTDAAIAD